MLQDLMQHSFAGPLAALLSTDWMLPCWVPPRPAPAQLDRRFWRKSSQWMTLTRSHAEAVLADVDVFRRAVARPGIQALWVN